MKKIIVFILYVGIICGLCACGKSETTAVPAEHSTAQTVSEPVQQKENKLGVVFCGMNIEATSDMLNDVCAQAGLNINDYSDVLSLLCNAQDEAMTCAMNCVDTACTDVLFVMYADEYIMVFDDVTAFYPDVSVYKVSLERPEQNIEFAIYDILYDFSGNRAWVYFIDDNNKKFAALIDENGNAKYVLNDQKIVRFDGGNTVINLGNGYLFLDKDGQTISEIHTDDSIKSIDLLGYSDHTWVLRKNVSSFSENGDYLFFVGDDGTVYEEEYDITNKHIKLEPIGKGLLCSNCYAKKQHLVDTSNRLFYEIDQSGNLGFLTDNLDSPDSVGLACFNNNKLFPITRDEVIRVFTTGDLSEIARYDSAFKGYYGYVHAQEGVFYYWDDNSFYDYNCNKIISIPEFPEKVKVSNVGAFSGDYAPIVLTGADGCSYVTMLKRDGTLAYEPVKFTNYNSGRYWHGYFFVNAKDYLDPTGKLIKETGDYFVKDFLNIAEDVTLLSVVDNKYESHWYIDGFGFCNDDGTHVIRKWDGTEVYDGITISNDAVYADGAEPYVKQDEPVQQPIEQTSQAPVTPSKSYTNVKNLSIEGKWKSVGSYGFGQAQPGNIVAFDGINCNFFSPKDTYAFSKDGDNYKLECTSFMSTDTLTFTVKTVDEDNIDIYYGDNVTELTRVN